jgi:hypothetical protein
MAASPPNFHYLDGKRTSEDLAVAKGAWTWSAAAWQYFHREPAGGTSRQGGE